MSTMLRHSPLIEAAFLVTRSGIGARHVSALTSMPAVGVIAATDVVQRWNLHRSGRRVWIGPPSCGRRRWLLRPLPRGFDNRPRVHRQHTRNANWHPACPKLRPTLVRWRLYANQAASIRGAAGRHRQRRRFQVDSGGTPARRRHPQQKFAPFGL